MTEARAQLIERVSSPPPVFRQFMPQASGFEVRGDSALYDMGRDVLGECRDFLAFVRSMREELITLDPETEEIRQASREMATTLWGAACFFYDTSEKIAQYPDPMSETIAALALEVAIELEDIAESEALGGSESFARAVQKDLEEYVTVKEPERGA